MGRGVLRTTDTAEWNVLRSMTCTWSNWQANRNCLCQSAACAILILPICMRGKQGKAKPGEAGQGKSFCLLPANHNWIGAITGNLISDSDRTWVARGAWCNEQQPPLNIYLCLAEISDLRRKSNSCQIALASVSSQVRLGNESRSCKWVRQRKGNGLGSRARTAFNFSLFLSAADLSTPARCRGW